jgi:UDP-glucose 4-epimerase
MILMERNDEGSDPKRRQIIALFGVGLIGQSILAAISRMGPSKIRELSFTWNVDHHQSKELEAIQQYILAPHNEDAISSVSRIDIVWAAGQSGFGSSEDQVIPEVNAFKKVLCFSLQLLNSATNIRHSFHLMSSAGGLFEGQRNVDAASLPRPLRPYSCAKIQQELFLLEAFTRLRKFIYRPSSVYGFLGKEIRLGLVNVLIQNSIHHQTSNIFGNLDTIRDYVLASDIGHFVANRLRDIDSKSQMFTLASGKPTTVLEILRRIERIFGRKIFYCFDKIRTNATDISFNQSVLPKFWYPTDLETGLRQTVRFLVSHSSPLLI